MKSLRPSKITYNVVGIAKAQATWLSAAYKPLNLGNWESDLDVNAKDNVSLDQIFDYAIKSPLPAILIDNTSSQAIADAYPFLLENGVSIATPNKKAFSGSFDHWKKIFAATEKPNGGLVYHESSVGAGLPIIGNLNDLITTGDEVISIEGIFSGTLSYIFNEFSTLTPSNVKFSDVVKIAKSLGYTEPDPRDDLNGLDVARKVTIVGRLSGLEIESPSSFPVQSLIPKQLESVKTASEFLEKLPNFDSELDELKEEALSEGKVLRFIGKVDKVNNKASVGIEKYDASHPFASLKGSDNVIAIKTKRYPNPVIVQGAGAGDAVTAAGVLADTIKIAQRIAA